MQRTRLPLFFEGSYTVAIAVQLDPLNTFFVLWSRREKEGETEVRKSLGKVLSACCELYAETCLKTICASRFFFCSGGPLAKWQAIHYPEQRKKRIWKKCFLLTPTCCDTLRPRLDTTQMGWKLKRGLFPKCRCHCVLKKCLPATTLHYCQEDLFLVFNEGVCGGRYWSSIVMVTKGNWRPEKKQKKQMDV